MANVIRLDQARRARGAETAKRRHPVKRDVVASLRRADLLRLWEQRDEAGGPPGRDVELGRLQLLLELGLPGTEAHKRAPWLPDGALERTIAAANANAAFWAGDATHTIADKIGERVELTFDEFKACGGFKYIAPCDAQPHEVRVFWDQRRRERDAERKRRHREAAKKHRAPRWSLRQRAVLAFLDGKGWQSTEEVAVGVRASPAFAGLSKEAMRQAIKRTFAQLLAAGWIAEHLTRERYCGSFKHTTRNVCLVPGKIVGHPA
jgi:hypothetical protein